MKPCRYLRKLIDKKENFQDEEFSYDFVIMTYTFPVEYRDRFKHSKNHDQYVRLYENILDTFNHLDWRNLKDKFKI